MKNNNRNDNPFLVDISKILEQLKKGYMLFEKNIKEILELLEKACSFPLHRMSLPGGGGNITYEIIMGSGIPSAPLSYSRLFACNTDSQRRLEIVFHIDGTIDVKFFWTDQSHMGKHYKKITPEGLMELAQEIKEHLAPDF